MNLNKRKFYLLMVALSFVLILVACGGKPTSQEAPPKQEPQSESKNAEPIAKEASTYYKDKTIEMVVPFGAGGGSDVLARYMAPYFNKHIEGNPSIQVVNIPGAGSVIGTNEFFAFRDADGYSALWTSGSTAINYLLKESGVQYDYKDLTPIVGVPTGAVVFASPDIGYQEPKDILNPSQKLIYSGQSPTGIDLVMLLSFELLGLDIQPILGYEGSGPARIAFEQGESNVNFQTTPAYLASVEPLVEEGKAIPLYTVGLVNAEGEIIRDPAFPDIPTIKEFYMEVHGVEPSGPVWEAFKAFNVAAFAIQKVLWVKNEVPEEAIVLLHEGAEAMAKDKEFLENGEEPLGGYLPVVGEELVNMVSNTLQATVDDEIIDWVYKFLDEKHNVSIN